MSPTVSNEFERICACGRSARATIFGAFGSLTSTAVKFFGALSCASHRMRLPSLASCIDMPSPMPPKPSSALCPSRRKFQTSESLPRSEEHTSELQSHSDLVCRLLLEKKKKNGHK